MNLQKNRARLRPVAIIGDARIKRIANDYYRRLTIYGIESASLWLHSQLEHPKDISLFRALQQDVARKYGMRWYPSDRM